jgi:phosphonate transport system substrate-binding protein
MNGTTIRFGNRLLALPVALALLAGCRGGGNAPAGPSGGPVATGGTTEAVGTAARPLTMVFVPSVNSEELAASADQLAKLLETETGYKVKGSVGTSYSAVVEAMGAGHVDIGWLNPFSYVLAHNKYGVEPLLITKRSGSRTYHGVIITRTDSGINALSDLKGKKFAFVDPLSTSGTIYPKLSLMAAGIDPDKDLAQTIFAGGHDKVVIAVYQKQADAGAIYAGKDRDARDRVQGTIPDVLEKTKVIAKTDEIPNDNVSVRKELPADVKTKLKTALQNVMATDAGRRILENYEIDGVESVTDADYDSIRKAALSLNIDLEEAVKPKKKG